MTDYALKKVTFIRKPSNVLILIANRPNKTSVRSVPKWLHYYRFRTRAEQNSFQNGRFFSFFPSIDKNQVQPTQNNCSRLRDYFRTFFSKYSAAFTFNFSCPCKGIEFNRFLSIHSSNTSVQSIVKYLFGKNNENSVILRERKKKLDTILGIVTYLREN